MLSLSLNEFELVKKRRHLKGYKSIPEVRLLSVLNEAESIKSGGNIDNVRIKKIRENFDELRDKF